MGEYERERCRNRLQNHYISLATVQVPDKPDFMLAAEARWIEEEEEKQREITPIIHKHKSLAQSKDMYSCSQCDVAFPSDHLLQEHIRNAHVSDHVAKNSGALSTHERQVHKGEARDHVCPHCNKTFHRAGLLEAHIRTHTGEKPFVCNVCAKGFAQKSALIRHELTHSENRPFACKDCGQRFRRQDKLKEHKCTYTTTTHKPYKCKWCDKRFHKSFDLIRHVRTHTGEKPYECKWCDKKFNQTFHLTQHERTHTGEKPYSCQRCTFRCSDATTLRKHKRTCTAGS